MAQLIQVGADILGGPDPDIDELLTFTELGGDVAVDERPHDRCDLECPGAKPGGPLPVDLDLDLGLGRPIVAVHIDQTIDLLQGEIDLIAGLGQIRPGPCP